MNQKSQTRGDAGSDAADSTRSQWLTYGPKEAWRKNLPILVVRMAVWCGLAWGVNALAGPGLDRAFGVSPGLTLVVVGAVWIVGFWIVLWNFPGARDYNPDLDGW